MLGAGELYRESGFSFIPSPPSLGRGSNEQMQPSHTGGVIQGKKVQSAGVLENP